jgi:ketosteroid isomerase-like protein
MSQENVETFRRAVEAYERHDVEGLLDLFDPEADVHPALLVTLGGEATVYRGHDGVREWLRDTDDAFAERGVDVFEVRDLGNRLVARGRTRFVGRASGVATESALAWVVDFNNGRVIRLRSFLDPNEALKAAGLSE